MTPRTSSLGGLDVENWVSKPQDTQHVSGFIAQLFTTIKQAMAVLTRLLSTTNHLAYQQSRNEYERFFLWGDGLSAADGALDEALTSSQELRMHLVTLLWRLGKVVLHGLLQTSDQSATSPDDELRVLLEAAEAMLQDTAAEGPSQPDLSPSFNSPDPGATELIEDISIYVSCLMDLSHVLDSLAVDSLSESSLVEYVPVKFEEHFDASSDEAMIYCQKIRDRFEILPKFLVERLAEANALRAEILRAIRAQPQKPETRVQDDASESLFSSQRWATDGTKSTAPLSSIFSVGVEPLPISGSLQPKREFNHDASLATFASCSTTASATSLGRPQVPPMPENYGHGFTCPICFKVITSVKTKSEWKRHVFEDLKPYICTEKDCDHRKTYGQRVPWAHHEASHISSHSGSFECLFCSADFQRGAPAYYKHVSAHLREVSLAVLPQPDDGSEEEVESSDSDDIINSPGRAADVLDFRAEQALWDPAFDDEILGDVNREPLPFRQCIKAWTAVRTILEAVVLGREIAHQHMVEIDSKDQPDASLTRRFADTKPVVLRSIGTRLNALEIRPRQHTYESRLFAPWQASRTYIQRLSENTRLDLELLQLLLLGFDLIERQVQRGPALYIRERTDLEDISANYNDRALYAFIAAYCRGTLAAVSLLPLHRLATAEHTDFWPPITSAQLQVIEKRSKAGHIAGLSQAARYNAGRLKRAAREGLYDLVLYSLLEEKPPGNPNAMLPDGMTALHHAAQSRWDSPEIVDILLAHGAFIDATREVGVPPPNTPGDVPQLPSRVVGDTPLYLALRHRRVRTTQELIKRGASVRMAVFCAVHARDAITVEYLYTSQVCMGTLGIAITRTEENWYRGRRLPLTPLQVSAALGDSRTAKALVTAMKGINTSSFINTMIARAFGIAMEFLDLEMAVTLAYCFEAWRPQECLCDDEGNHPLTLLLKMVVAKKIGSTDKIKRELRTIAFSLAKRAMVHGQNPGWSECMNRSGQTAAGILEENRTQLAFLNSYSWFPEHDLSLLGIKGWGGQRINQRFVIGPDEDIISGGLQCFECGGLGHMPHQCPKASRGDDTGGK